jgi:hypothetical protein
MAYYIAPNGDYPRHIGDIQRDNPDYVEGGVLPEGWVEVAYGTIPEIDTETETWFEIEPKEVDGVLTRQFETRPLTAAEILARSVEITV